MKIKEKYYESVGEQVYFTRLSNGLTIHLIPKEDYYETYDEFLENEEVQAKVKELWSQS